MVATMVVVPAHAEIAPDDAARDSARRGARYLAGEQAPDGGIPGLGDPSVHGTAEAVAALVAGGGQDDAVDRAVDFIADRASHWPDCDVDNGGPELGQIVSGIVAAGEDPTDFAGRNPLALLESCAEVDGTYGGRTLYADALAMLGVLAGGGELPDRAVTYLRTNQCGNGGWAPQTPCLNGDNAETDYTAVALSVLVAVEGADDDDVRQARQWLQNTQNDTGCWGFRAGAADQPNSCGLAISAVVALGEDPKEDPWSAGDRNPLGRLREFQLGNGGFVRSVGNAEADNFVTIQAVPAQAHWSYPVAPPDPEPDPGGDDGSDSDDGDDREGTRRTTSTVTRYQGSDGRAGSQGGNGSGDRRAPQVDSSPYETTTTRQATTSTGVGSEDRSAGTPAIRRPPPGVASATFDGDRDGVGAVPTALAVGSLGSVALAAGWYWRRRAVTAGLVPWSRG